MARWPLKLALCHKISRFFWKASLIILPIWYFLCELDVSKNTECSNKIEILVAMLGCLTPLYLVCVLCQSTSWNLTVTFNWIFFGAQHPISISARIQWLHCPDKMQSVDWSARNIAFTIDYNYKITTIHINHYSAFIPIVDKNHWAKLHLTCGIK